MFINNHIQSTEATGTNGASFFSIPIILHHDMKYELYNRFE